MQGIITHWFISKYVDLATFIYLNSVIYGVAASISLQLHPILPTA